MGLDLPRRAGRKSGTRDAAARLLGVLGSRYRALKRRLGDLIGRGDRDYATLTALSQEIGRLRQKLRAELERRRRNRKRNRPRLQDGAASAQRRP